MFLYLCYFNIFHTHIENYFYSTFDFSYNLLSNVDLQSCEICFINDFDLLFPVTILFILELTSIVLFGTCILSFRSSKVLQLPELNPTINKQIIMYFTRIYIN